MTREAALLRGRARARVVAVLAAALALNTADSALIGAVGPQLEGAFQLNQTQLGLAVAVPAAIGIVAAPVAGVFADRSDRSRMLATLVAVWAAAMAGGAVAPTYGWLLLTRVALGAAVAAAGPVVSSLVGDSFSPPERGRVLGWVLAGEIAGAGAGLLIGAVVGALISWRAGFAALALLSALVSLLVLRQLPEPPRGGAYRSRDRWSWWRAVRSVLAIPSVRRLILASAIGYFFFAGLRTFSVLLATHRYGLTTSSIVLAAALIGFSALLGAVLGGRLADAWARRSDPGARLYVVAGGTILAIVLFAPGLLTGSRGLALLLFILGTAGLGAANPALDAARLEVIPAALWGRAESVRTVLRLGAESTGPVVFGLVADALATRGNQASALRDTFLIMLAPLALSAAIVLLTRRRFPGDVAAASSH